MRTPWFQHSSLSARIALAGSPVGASALGRGPAPWGKFRRNADGPKSRLATRDGFAAVLPQCYIHPWRLNEK